MELIKDIEFSRNRGQEIINEIIQKTIPECYDLNDPLSVKNGE
jgi:hypothetical protein